MSNRKANTTLIGGFIIGAFIVVIGIIIFFGSFSFFTRNEKFVVYFDESVNGLSVGNSVKFRGVRIGRVSDIRVRYNQVSGSRHIPVFIEIENNRLLKENDLTVDFSDPNVVQTMVRRGLRARLQLESLVTGVSYVDLDFSGVPGEVPEPIQLRPEYREIPSVKSPMAAIGISASEILANVGSIDFNKLGANLNELLETLNSTVGALDVKAINDSLVSAARSLEELLGSQEIRTALVSMESTLEEYKSLASTLRERIDPVLTNVEGLSAEARVSLETLQNTLKTFERVAVSVESFVGPESTLSTEARYTLEELSRTMRAFRELLQFIEQNPNSILFGRQTKP